MARVGRHHKTIINAVDRHEGPFVIAKISEAANVTKPHVRTVLEVLATLGFVRKRAASLTDKWWVKTRRWEEQREDVVMMYETFKAVQRGRRLAARRLRRIAETINSRRE